MIIPIHSLARKAAGWEGTNLPFTITSIPGAMKGIQDIQPKLIVAVNPGFNVEEWIDLTKLIRNDCTLIVFNGNLDRVTHIINKLYFKDNIM